MIIQNNIILAPYTTFHIGGPADYFIIASTPDELIAAVSWADEKKLPFFVLGQGANILIGDKGFRGVVIKNEAREIRFPSSLRAVARQTTILVPCGKQSHGAVLNSDEIAQGDYPFHGVAAPPIKSGIRNDDTVLITAESGATIAELIDRTAELGLSGLEHYAGIPSSLGGAVWQNLHFLSPDRISTVFIADIVQEAEVFRFKIHDTRFMKRETVGKSYFKFDYDYSILHDTHDVVLSVTMRLQTLDKARIRQTIQENLAWRNAKHPQEAWKKSAGSVFKKIEGYGAGRLIEQAGLKGKRIGGAEISQKHANFIVNTDNATAKDVRDLISLTQSEVKKTTGLSLETEISFVGEF